MNVKENARILKFDVKKLRTTNELSAAQQALLQDIISGAVTISESQLIQKELDYKALKSIFGYLLDES